MAPSKFNLIVFSSNKKSDYYEHLDIKYSNNFMNIRIFLAKLEFVSFRSISI
jgi:hypothetical protein